MSDATRTVREALVRFENGAVAPHIATIALTALDSLADQVRAEERERIAVFVETASVPIGIEHWMSTKKALSAATARAIAAAIRARGEGHKACENCGKGRATERGRWCSDCAGLPSLPETKQFCACGRAPTECDGSRAGCHGPEKRCRIRSRDVRDPMCGRCRNREVQP